MSKRTFLVGVMSVGGVIILVALFFSITKLPTTNSTSPGWETYRSPFYHFSIDYPEMYHVADSNDSIMFTAGDSDPWQYELAITPTDAATTQAWLDQQPQSTGATTGIQFLNWMSAGSLRFAWYVDYIVVDQDTSQPAPILIYGQSVKAALVYQGYVITFFSREFQMLNQKPQIDPVLLKMVQSFAPLTLTQ